jgi:hypothetical protein
MTDLRVDSDFQQKYARAREDQADYLADEIIGISDEAQTEQVGEDGLVKYDATAVARNRLRVDTRKWAASKMKPKKYGERTTLAGDPEAPLFDLPSLVKALDGASSGLPKIEG